MTIGQTLYSLPLWRVRREPRGEHLPDSRLDGLSEAQHWAGFPANSGLRPG